MDRQWIRIGEVASRAGVNVQTLRYYERRGILEALDDQHSTEDTGGGNSRTRRERVPP